MRRGVYTVDAAALAAVLACCAALAAPEEQAGAAPEAQNSRIAFDARPDDACCAQDPTEVYTVDPEGADEQQLTDNDVADTDPAVGGDGRRIAYSYVPRYPSCGCDGSENVFTVRPGGLWARVLFDLDEQAVALGLDYSPDGSRLAVGILNSGQQATSVVTVGSDG